MINKVFQMTVFHKTQEASLAAWVYDYEAKRFYIEFPSGEVVNIGRFTWKFHQTKDGILAVPVIDFNKYFFKKTK